MGSRKDRFMALGVAIVALLAAAVEAPEPCCLRVTPYHIQALAQRMAQRFQALEYRAQDLRGVFASFQAVHGNVSHRLRYLEVEHAHLTETVSRLDSRLQWLEQERKLEDYRKKVGYYRGQRAPRSASRMRYRKHHHFRSKSNTLEGDRDSDKHYKLSDTSSGKTAHVRFRKTRENVSPLALFPFVRFRRSDASVLPPLRVHLDQPEAPSLVTTSGESHSSLLPIDEQPPNANTDPHSEEQEVQVGGVPSPEGALPSTPLAPSAADAPVFAGGSVVSDGAIMGAPGTTPTPLWQLEESADDLLQAMSAGDEDDANALLLPPQLPLAEGGADSVSYWSLANETDSLEQLFGPSTAAAANKSCAGHANCEEAVTEAVTSPTGMIHHSTTTPDSIVEATQDSTDSNPPFHKVDDSDELHPTSAIIDNTIPVVPTMKVKPKWQGTIASTPAPSHDSLAPPAVNESQSLLDVFPPGVGGAGDGGAGSAGGPCQGAGCDASQHELSDAELQEALRELDTLLQRPPAEAPPPDPEKLLLKRALKLALAALERTSDACLTLVNFTADAFEGLAAAEGMAGAAGSAELHGGSATVA